MKVVIVCDFKGFCYKYEADHS